VVDPTVQSDSSLFGWGLPLMIVSLAYIAFGLIVLALCHLIRLDPNWQPGAKPRKRRSAEGGLATVYSVVPLPLPCRSGSLSGEDPHAPHR